MIIYPCPIGNMPWMYEGKVISSPWLSVIVEETELNYTYKFYDVVTFLQKFLLGDIPYIACEHYNDVIMSMMASQITSLTIVHSSIYTDADQRKHQSSVSLAFVRGIHRWPVNSPHKGQVTWKMFPFKDVIMGDISVPVLYVWWS